MYYIVACMPRRVPTAKELARRGPGGSRRVLAIRLNEPDYVKLVAHAKRAGLGHTSLVRRIVEDWLANQRGRL